MSLVCGYPTPGDIATLLSSEGVCGPVTRADGGAAPRMLPPVKRELSQGAAALLGDLPESGSQADTYARTAARHTP